MENEEKQQTFYTRNEGKQSTLYIHTYIQTEKPTCAADLIIYHLVAIAMW